MGCCYNKKVATERKRHERKRAKRHFWEMLSLENNKRKKEKKQKGKEANFARPV
jgi:hypothetical protein